MIGLVVDIETTGFRNYDSQTGLLADSSEILEVGYLRIDMETGGILNHGTLYFYKPYFQVESDAQKIHGLTRSFLEPYEKDFNTNLLMLNSLIQKTCIIGKNSEGFDIPFIRDFLIKHSDGVLDFQSLIMKAKIKKYDDSWLMYDPLEFSLDLQKIFKDEFHRLYYKKTGIELAPQKRGTLTDYINAIDGAQECVDAIYNSLEKARETRAHGALYDCVATYVVWFYCKQNELY